MGGELGKNLEQLGYTVNVSEKMRKLNTQEVVWDYDDEHDEQHWEGADRISGTLGPCGFESRGCK